MNVTNDHWTDDTMPDRPSDRREPIDHRTSLSICKAIGERLGQHMGPETPVPSHLQRLMDEMRRQDDESAQG